MDSINNACKYGSDAWVELQAFKTRQLNRREKLNRHKNLNQDSILTSGSAQSSQHSTISSNNVTSTHSTSQNSASSFNLVTNSEASCSGTSVSRVSNQPNIDVAESVDDSLSNRLTTNPSHDIDSKSLQNSLISDNDHQSSIEQDQHHIDLIENLLLVKLCDVALKLPIDSRSLSRSIAKIKGFENNTKSLIENLLQKFAHQELIAIEEPASIVQLNRPPTTSRQQIIDESEESCIYVTSADHTKLVELDKSFDSIRIVKALLADSKTDAGSDDNSDSANALRLITNTEENDKCANISDNKYKQYNPRDSTHIGLRHDKSSTTTASKNREHAAVSDDLESLLSLSSTRERENKKLGEELLELLSKPTAKERNLLERFRSADGYRVQEFCPKGTKGECVRNSSNGKYCDKLHFKKIIAKHTEESLGDCSFLNTCFHMDTCKYVHYEVDYDENQQQHQFKKPMEPGLSRANRRHGNLDKNLVKPITSSQSVASTSGRSYNNLSQTRPTVSLISSTAINQSQTSNTAIIYKLSPEEQAQLDAKNRKRFKTVLYPPQWIQCDLRFFDMSLLGKFSVVMADPPWDIHMELPYGTMSDDEMRKLNVPALQDEGVIFLWVTGRAMELGRECLSLWGYERCDEIIWVKTNQLQRIIRTGRTGHWLNHGKEHCLVGVKGNPKDINRGLDCDVIVAEVRATSHKPDEIYGIIERLSPGTRKIELFGRAHNVQPNWITLGNQLNGVKLVDPNLVNEFKKLNLPFQTAD